MQGVVGSALRIMLRATRGTHARLCSDTPLLLYMRLHAGHTLAFGYALAFGHALAVGDTLTFGLCLQ